MNFHELSEVRKKVGLNIKNARKAAGYRSIRQLAKKLSFSHDKLARIERGEISASHIDIDEIARVLNIPSGVLREIHPTRKHKLSELKWLLIHNEKSNLIHEIMHWLTRDIEESINKNDIVESRKVLLNLIQLIEERQIEPTIELKLLLLRCVDDDLKKIIWESIIGKLCGDDPPDVMLYVAENLATIYEEDENYAEAIHYYKLIIDMLKKNIEMLKFLNL